MSSALTLVSLIRFDLSHVRSSSLLVAVCAPRVSRTMSSPSPSPSSPSPPPSPSDALLLQAIVDPNRRAVTWHQLWSGDGLPESDRKIVADCKRLVVWRAVVGASLAGGLVGGIGQSSAPGVAATIYPAVPLTAALTVCWCCSVYGRGLMTSQRRYVVTLASALWGTATGAMSASPVCMNRASHSTDPDSVLRKELARIAVQHNPNRAMESVAREKIAQAHRLREQQEKERQLELSYQQSVAGDGQHRS